MHYLEIVSHLDDRHLPQVRNLIEAARAADGHEPLGEHKFLRLCHGDDYAAAVLAYAGETLVGYAHTVIFETDGEQRASCEVVVAPLYRRRGVGTELLDRAMEQARRQGVDRFDLWGYNSNATSEGLAARARFEPARRLLHLHRHASAFASAPAPDGVAVRPFRVGEDERRWLALNSRIFADHPENGGWTLDDLAARMAQPWFDPHDLLMLDVDGEPAGFCWLKVEERPGEGRVGEIYVIGTVPEVRGHGLGRYLLARGLARLAEHSVDVVAIYVDEANCAAVRLYGSAGFHHHHVDICYSLRLDGSEAAGERTAA